MLSRKNQPLVLCVLEEGECSITDVPIKKPVENQQVDASE
jgi:hypothetical protein